MSSLPTSAAAAAAACALGVACGSIAANRGAEPRSLPEAGSLRDDGSGMLYQLSVRPELGGAAGGQTYGGQTYGGQTYGAGAYGGARYAGYTFEPVYKPSSPPAQPYAPGYLPTEVKRGGTIAGSVSWPAPPRAAAIRFEEPAAGCRRLVEPDGVRVDARGRVQGAVVFLDGIRRGRRHPTESPGYGAGRHYSGELQTGGVLVRRGCRLSPHVQVVAPIGGVLVASNLDRGDHSLQATRHGISGAAQSDPFAIRLAGRGATSDVVLDSGGFYSLNGVADSDPAHAWVVVAEHPYYAVTDGSGSFRLDDVPAGTHTLVVWHPPVVLGRGPGGAIRRSPPVIERRRIKVRERRVSRVGVELTR